MFQLHHVVLVSFILHGVMAVCTKKTTSATGTSTEPTVTSTAMTPTTVKSATTNITTSKTTTPAPSSATSAAGRRKRDVDNGKPVETDRADPASPVEICDDNSSVAVVHGYTTTAMAVAAFVIIYKEQI